MRRERTINRIHIAAAWAGVLLILVMAVMNAGLAIEPAKDAVRGRVGFDGMTGKIASGYVSDGLWQKNALINLNGLFARLTGQRSYNGVLRLNNGMLTYGQDPLAGADPLVYVSKAAAFSDFLASLDIPYLFVQVPIKVDSRGDLIPRGFGYTTLEKTGQWVQRLRAEGVDVLDLRQLLAGSVGDVEKNYYRTDHHWNAEGAFAAFGRVMDRIGEILGGLDTGFTDPALWQKNSLEHWFLGSHGKRVGTLYAGTDPLTWYTPGFPTEMSCILTKYRQIFAGDYAQANLRARYLEKKDYFNDNAYCVTIGGDYPLVQHRNAGAPNKQRILLLKDSFGLPLQSYLSTEFAMVDVIDPRHYTDSSIAEYCLWTKPDLVITVLNPSSLGESSHFDFGTADPLALRERQVWTEERITLEASDNDWHFYRLPFVPEAGKAYRFSFGRISVTEGNTAGASVLLFDFRKNEIVRHQIFDVSFSAQGGDWTFRVPGDGPEDADWGLLVYAGVHGSTGGIALEYGDVKVSALE